MKTINNKTRIFAVIISLVTLVSCSSVKGYQKMYLNDGDMALESRNLEYFEINFHTYREGAAGSNGGKVGGGCGCN